MIPDCFFIIILSQNFYAKVRENAEKFLERPGYHLIGLSAGRIEMH